MDKVTMTMNVRPAGSFRVEKDDITGEEKLVLVDPPTAPNDKPNTQEEKEDK